jgi:integrase
VVGALFFYSQRKELTMRVRLTEEFIRTSLHCPEDRKAIEFVAEDPEVTGLLAECARGTPGRAIYRFRFKHPDTGKTTYIRLGTTSEIGLSDAVARAREFRQALNAGHVPTVTDQKPKGVPTLSEFFPQYLEQARAVKKDRGKKDEELFRIRLHREFGHLKLDAITRQHVQTYLASLVSKEGLKPATGNRTISLLRRILGVALEWQLIEKHPIARVKLLPENNKSDRYMTPEEMARLMAVLKTYPARLPCQVAMLLLATGARLSEALNATWVNIDREHRLWKIPASDSKSGKVRSVPLNDVAIEVLDQLGTQGKYEWVFAKENGERYKYMHQVWGRIRKKAGLEWVTLHRLRHQHAALLVQSGRTLFEAQAILGHSDPSMTMRYAHLSTRVLQDASDEVSEAIATAMQRAG